MVDDVTLVTATEDGMAEGTIYKEVWEENPVMRIDILTSILCRGVDAILHYPSTSKTGSHSDKVLCAFLQVSQLVASPISGAVGRVGKTVSVGVGVGDGVGSNCLTSTSQPPRNEHRRWCSGRK